MARLTASWITDVYYERLLDRIYLNHHVYPTNIPKYQITPVEGAEMSEYNALGRELSKGQNGPQPYRDPDFCNGVPRRGH